MESRKRANLPGRWDTMKLTTQTISELGRTCATKAN